MWGKTNRGKKRRIPVKGLIIGQDVRRAIQALVAPGVRLIESALPISS
jgi:hypothetical protein